MKTVIGLYDRREDARDTIQDLVDAGFSRDRISLATQSERGDEIDLQRSDRVREYDADKETERDRSYGTESGEGAAIGGTVGAIMGGIGGLLIGLGTIVIPGLGVIAAAGPLAGLLAGALAGGVAGGIVGALVGLGIPEEEARVYAEGVRRGGTLVVLQTEDNRVDEAQRIMERYNPVNIEHRAERWREEGWEVDADRRHPEERVERTTGIGHDVRPEHEVRGSRPFEGRRDLDAAIDQYMQEHEHEFRRHFETELADTGRDYSYFRPAYTYGCKLAHSDQYSDREWREIETEARRRWLEINGEESWHMVEDAVRTSYTSCRR
jgi:hypothetical protein